MTAGEILRKAAALITPPGAWTHGAYARDASGSADVVSYSAQAVCWCMDGALRRVGLRHRHYSSAVHALVEVCRADSENFYPGHIHNFNDACGRTQAECVAKMLEAADLADAR